MLARVKRPDIGTMMYHVQEHLYYEEDIRVSPFLEYCVCEAVVVGFFQGGYEEVCLKGLSPNGHPTPYYYKLRDIGSKIFYTAKDAAGKAKERTEKYEQTWGWLGKPDIPLRRSWEKYLKDDLLQEEKVKS